MSHDQKLNARDILRSPETQELSDLQKQDCTALCSVDASSDLSLGIRRKLLCCVRISNQRQLFLSFIRHTHLVEIAGHTHQREIGGPARSEVRVEARP